MGQTSRVVGGRVGACGLHVVCLVCGHDCEGCVGPGHGGCEWGAMVVVALVSERGGGEDEVSGLDVRGCFHFMLKLGAEGYDSLSYCAGGMFLVAA
jgi:hypothetical protein